MSETTGSCDNCALCCQYLLVEADAVDVLREPRIESERPLGNIHPRLSVLDVCWLLAGPGMPCPFLTPEKKCDIYPTRPEDCVAFVPGSPKCQELRKEFGLAPVMRQPSDHRVLSEIMKAAIEAEMNHPDTR